MRFTIPLLRKSRKAPVWKWHFAACLFALFLGNGRSLAQAPSPKPAGENWKLIQEVQGVKFYYQVSQCHGHPFLLFKIANGNEATVRGSWEIKVHNNGHTRMCVGVLRSTPAGQALAGSCERPAPDLAVSFPDLNPATLQVSATAKITPQ